MKRPKCEIVTPINIINNNIVENYGLNPQKHNKKTINPQILNIELPYPIIIHWFVD
jgi:hypothetical protein